jgi:hypothetical protein
MSNPGTPTSAAQLGSLAGRWQTSGHVIGEPHIPVAGSDIYELFPGGHFLVHHVDVTVGDQPVRAIEIIGEPNGRGGYLARSFLSDGTVEVMDLTIDDDGVFHFAGGSDIAAAAQPLGPLSAQVRSTLRVAPDQQSMTALWERSDDGTSWQPWMDITFRLTEMITTAT